jgi:copper chaperone NosL
MFSLSLLSRIALIAGALALLLLLRVPIWKIYLTAPQYPEGLEMKIWHDTLTGDVKVISALNHYIGMRPISPEMFPEFEYLGKIIVAVVALCLLLALIGRWWSALFYALILVTADGLALYDFWRWGYEYGHNLDPSAPIVIPGMAYQPPVVGYKRLLNFEAWSLPDTGGWILIAVTSIGLFVVGWEWWRWRRGVLRSSPAGVVVGLLLLLTVQACDSGPRPIPYGQGECAMCHMSLSDRRYGAEILTRKGKTFFFDDLNCMVHFEAGQGVASEEIAGRWAADFAQPGRLVAVEQAVFVHSPALRTPMASQVAAFALRSDAEKVRAEGGGELLNWESTKDLFLR